MADKTFCFGTLLLRVACVTCDTKQILQWKSSMFLQFYLQVLEEEQQEIKYILLFDFLLFIISSRVGIVVDQSTHYHTSVKPLSETTSLIVEVGRLQERKEGDKSQSKSVIMGALKKSIIGRIYLAWMHLFVVQTSTQSGIAFTYASKINYPNCLGSVPCGGSAVMSNGNAANETKSSYNKSFPTSTQLFSYNGDDLSQEETKVPLKVLFLSSDTGGGHRASAEALAKQVRHL